ncbi:MAG TPA: hypothetical protein VNA04_06050 [Thermoanaerobaculia bacterium]|nr:hypothetical protein [Thermoanaerobaculia bacterium]
MASNTELVRDFALQLEKTLAARRLYNPASAPYREANERLLEKCRAAAQPDGFTLRLGPADLYLDDQPVISKARREEAFFFPLYRDGLRDLKFTSATSPNDLEALLSILELRDQQLGADEDLVTHLWRADLTTIRHSAVDGLSDNEDLGSEGGKDLRALSLVLLEKMMRGRPVEIPDKPAIEEPRSQEELDAAGVRATIAQNPAMLALTPEQEAELRLEGTDRDQKLMERFIEMLLVIARLPFRSIEPALIAPILTQLIDSYWHAGELDRVAVLISHVSAAGRDAPSPHARTVMAGVITSFLTEERAAALMTEYEKGSISPALAEGLWGLLADATIWPLLLDSYSRLPDGEPKQTIFRALCNRASSNLELLTGTFWAPEHHRVRAVMTLLDPQTELLLTDQLIPLASHPEEPVRRKGLAAAARSGNPAAMEILWKAMESDPSKSIRLFAFRLISTADLPELAPRLRALVTTPQFAERPVWEREKYIRLLGKVGGPEAEALFESWIPAKRWRWQAAELETLELALRGLASCGDGGYEKVRRMSEAGGKLAEVARKVLDSVSRAEIGETAMRPLPDDVTVK